MLKLAHTAYAAALVSVMAISVGPAKAQVSADEFYELACIDSKGLCYTQDSEVDALAVPDSGYVNTYRPYATRYTNMSRPYYGARYTNMYRPYANGSRYTNVYRPYVNGSRYTNQYPSPVISGGGVYVPYSSPLAPGLFGLALEAALATYPAIADNNYSNVYIAEEAILADDHVAACEARYRSYDPATDMFLGYDGNYHRCNL